MRIRLEATVSCSKCPNFNTFYGDPENLIMADNFESEAHRHFAAMGWSIAVNPVLLTGTLEQKYLCPEHAAKPRVKSARHGGKGE